jgi:hypothetical protein
MGDGAILLKSKSPYFIGKSITFSLVKYISSFMKSIGFTKVLLKKYFGALL